MAMFWIGFWGILFLKNDVSASAEAQLFLLLWVFCVPLFWLIPSIAGRPQAGKTETTTIEYPPYKIGKR